MYCFDEGTVYTDLFLFILVFNESCIFIHIESYGDAVIQDETGGEFCAFVFPNAQGISMPLFFSRCSRVRTPDAFPARFSIRT